MFVDQIGGPCGMFTMLIGISFFTTWGRADVHYLHGVAFNFSQLFRTFPELFPNLTPYGIRS
mgnify:CR=1 FL=1